MDLSIQLVGHVAFMGLMIILIIIGITKAHIRGPNWLNIHKRIMIFGVLSGIIGFLVMAVHKLSKSFPHFTSIHSKGGFLALIFAVITPIFGIMITKKLLRQKGIHKISGVFTLIFCILALVFGILKFVG